MPYAVATSLDGYSAEEIVFNHELLKKGNYTYTGQFLYDDKIPCIRYNYITWQGVDLYEELKTKFEIGYKPLGRSAPEDMIGLLNYNIWKEIDKEECKKIMDCIYKEVDKKPFVVVSVTSGYNTIDSVDYVDRFNSKAEADALIKEREKERIRLFENRKEFIYNYLRSCNSAEIRSDIINQTKCYGYDNISLSLYLTDNPHYDGRFPYYNPPKRIQSKGVDFVVEMKGKSND